MRSRRPTSPTPSTGSSATARRESLEALATELGIADRVKFCGNLDRPDALATIGECHVLLLPSLHDSGGWVFLEAMAAGRPVICANLGGPPVQVTEECGIRVAAESPEQTVRDLAAAMVRLSGDRELCRRMGEAGQRRVAEHLSWDHHADRAVRAYGQATVRSASLDVLSRVALDERSEPQADGEAVRRTHTRDS